MGSPAALGGGRAAGLRARRRVPVRRAARQAARPRAEQRKQFAVERGTALAVASERPGAPLDRYLREQEERIVRITFPDERRRERVAGTTDTYRTTLLPLELLWWRLVVSCTLRCWHDPERAALRIRARKLAIDGAPKELDLERKVRIKLDGILKLSREPTPRLLGKVRLELDADVPDMLLATPGFEDVVTGILDASIARLEGSIAASLLKDYEKWAETAEALVEG